MDAEIKDLLTDLLKKLDGFEERLRSLESKAHDQITVDDYFRKYGDFPRVKLDTFTRLPPNDILKTTFIC